MSFHRSTILVDFHRFEAMHADVNLLTLALTGQFPTGMQLGSIQYHRLRLEEPKAIYTKSARLMLIVVETVPTKISKFVLK